MSETSMPDARGRYGAFGGRYVPETLVPALLELEQAWRAARADPAFDAELDELLARYAGRETPLSEARRMSADAGGCRVLLKREDLCHTGSHKLNNTLGQILLARRMGKRRIIAETGAGQHGVATATVCALLGLECVVYMGEVDVARQSLNVFRMKLLGATVTSVKSGTATLKDAMNEALRNWVTVNSYSSSSVMSRSRRRPMSRLQPNELGTNPCRSKASRQSRTNSSVTSG